MCQNKIRFWRKTRKTSRLAGETLHGFHFQNCFAMKKICLAVSLLFALQHFLFAQNQPSKTTFKTWFYLQKPKSAFSAKAEQMKDSSILVSSLKASQLDNFDIPVNRIEEIRWREKGRVGRGIGAGAAVGFGLGFIVGFGTASGEPSDFLYISPGEQGLIFGILGGLIGGVVGGIVSAFDTKVSIGGSQSEYERQKEKLKQLTGGR